MPVRGGLTSTGAAAGKPRNLEPSTAACRLTRGRQLQPATSDRPAGQRHARLGCSPMIATRLCPHCGACYAVRRWSRGHSDRQLRRFAGRFSVCWPATSCLWRDACVLSRVMTAPRRSDRTRPIPRRCGLGAGLTRVRCSKNVTESTLLGMHQTLFCVSVGGKIGLGGFPGACRRR